MPEILFTCMNVTVVCKGFQKVVENCSAPNLRPETKSRLYTYALNIGPKSKLQQRRYCWISGWQRRNFFFFCLFHRSEPANTSRTHSYRRSNSNWYCSQSDFDRGRACLIFCWYWYKGSGIDPMQWFRYSMPDHNRRSFQRFFKPDYGTIIAYRHAGGYGIRLDEGSSYQGVKVSPFFDSMLVKITAKERTLKGTSRRLYRCFSLNSDSWVKTNIAFLENNDRHPLFGNSITVRFYWNILTCCLPKQLRTSIILRYLADVLVINPDVAKMDKKQSIPRTQSTGVRQ